MGKKLILSFFLSFLFIVCLSCSSNLPDNGVTILKPNDEDKVKMGDSFEVRWKTEPAESEFGVMVTIEFSRDGGKSWEKVQENVQNTGIMYGPFQKWSIRSLRLPIKHLN